MATRWSRLSLVVLMCLAIPLAPSLFAADAEEDQAPKPGSAAVALPDDADKAWEEVARFTKARNQTEARGEAIPLADHASAFIAKFPKDPRLGQARQFALRGYGLAAA